ncbi:MAG: OstA-like protein, partial [Bacteroidota bacterium]
VRLDNKGQKLFTNRLNYDLNTKIASYFTGATLSNDTTHLVSKRGYYYVSQDEAFFKDSVVVVDPDFVLRSDTLQFSTKTRIVTFLGPTLIQQDTANIYCEGGYYDTRRRYAEFLEEPEYVKGEQEATAERIIYDGTKKEVLLVGDAHFDEGPKKASADIIRYDEIRKIIDLEGRAHYEDEKQEIDSEFIQYDSKNEVFKTQGRAQVVDGDQLLDADSIDYDGTTGIARGNVIWTDTSDNITINCQQMIYNKETDYVKASGGRPLLTSLIDGDTLFMSSDTLVSVAQAEGDSTRTLLGYRDVRIFKSNLQVVCDSLVYSTSDSLFEFFQSPIIWSDTSQFYADTVRMQLSNDQIDQIFLTNDAYIINSPDEVFFNQIKGKNIVALFRNNELHQMDVVGNAESLYYARDEEDAYMGVNKSVCSKMLVYFAENEIKDIYFYTQPTSNILPMRNTNHEQIRLEGFRWDIQRRPESLEDLLKEKVRPANRNRPSTAPEATLSKATSKTEDPAKGTAKGDVELVPTKPKPPQSTTEPTLDTNVDKAASKVKTKSKKQD